MTKKLIPAGLCAALMLLGAAVVRADDAEYAVKFHRPVKVGDKFSVNSTVEITRSMRIEVNGAETQKQSESVKYTIDAVMNVTSIDEQARENGFHLVINQLEGSENGAAAGEILPKGAQVDVVYKDHKAEFTLKDGELSPAQLKALNVCFEPHQSQKTDDDMFGTPDKHKAGDTWPVNSKAMSEDAQGSPMQVDADKIAGKVKLVGAKAFSGIPAVEVEGTIEITDFTIDGVGKARAGDSKMNVNLSGQLPTDSANPSSAMKMDLKLHGVFDKEGDGNKATMTMDADIKRNETMVAQ